MDAESIAIPDDDIMPGTTLIMAATLQPVALGVGPGGAGRMVVSPRLGVAGSSVPGGLVEIAGVVSGREAGLLGAAVSFRLQLPLELSALPIGPSVGAVPVELPGPLGEVIPGADGAAQLITAPGVAGSDASGIGAKLVSVAPGRVAAENGLGPFRGDDITAPGMVGKPIAVVPMVETCARPARQPSINSSSANPAFDIAALTSPASAL